MRSGRLLSFIALAFVLMYSSGCTKSTAGTFTMKLNGKYGAQSFAEDSFYTDPSGRVLTFSNFMFYLSNITLIKTDGSQVNVSDVSYFSFNNPQALTITVPNIDGNFKAITFGCGLDSIQNLTDPNSVAATSPLSGNYGMYWPMLKYQFEVVEGKWDTAEIPLMRNAILYHIGTNATFRQTTLNQNFSVCCGGTTTINVNLDVKKIFYGATETLDIGTPGQSSTQMGPVDNPTTGPTFADNFSQAFSIAQ